MGLKASRRRYMYHVCLHDRRKCSPVNVVSSDIRVMQIFTGGREIWGVKQFVSSYYISMISLHNAVARLLSVSYGLSCLSKFTPMVGRGNDVIDLLPPYSSKTSRATALSPVTTWMGDRLRVPPRYGSTQPCIPPQSLNRVQALIGWTKGRDVTSAGWQVTVLSMPLHWPRVSDLYSSLFTVNGIEKYAK